MYSKILADADCRRKKGKEGAMREGGREGGRGEGRGRRSRTGRQFI